MKPVTYRWNADAPQPDKTTLDLGFLAQQVKEVLPESLRPSIVKEIDEEGHMGLSYSKITAVLTGALQEQQLLLDAQKETTELLQRTHEERIDAQQRTIDAFSSSISQLETLVASMYE